MTATQGGAGGGKRRLPKPPTPPKAKAVKPVQRMGHTMPKAKKR